MHFAKKSALLAFAALAFAAPVEKRDYVSDGILVIETTVVVTITENAVAGSTGFPSLSIPSFNSSSYNSSTSDSGSVPTTTPLDASYFSAAPSAPVSTRVARKSGHKSKAKSKSAVPSAAPTIAAPNAPAAVSTSPDLPAVVSSSPNSVPNLPAVVSSAPASAPSAAVVSQAPAGGLTSAQIVAISPGTASCANPPAPGECHTADEVAAPFAASFVKYKISNTAAQAAALSLALFESAGFKYNTRHFPVTPGVGTFNMQSASYNRMYATSLGLSPPASDDDMLKLLLGVNESSGSAAWFMSTQCPGLVAAFAANVDTAWTSYHQCIGTALTPERTAIFTAAKKVLGVS